MSAEEILKELLATLPRCCRCGASATVECGPDGETWSLCDKHREYRYGSKELGLEGSDYQWADVIRKIAK